MPDLLKQRAQPRKRSTHKTTPVYRRAEADQDVGESQNDARAALLPDELLQPGEVVLLLIKPSPLYIVLSCLKSLAIMGIITLAAMYVADFGWVNLDQNDVLTAGVGLIAIRLVWQFLEWLSRVYVLTDRRVIRVKGVVTVQLFEAPLKQIQHTECTFTLRERLFGLGSVAFSTAGTALPEAYWLMVANPLTVHQTVVKAIDRYS